MHTKNRNASFPKLAFINVLLLLLVSTLNAQGPSDESRAGQWRMAGQNLSNTWSQPAEHSISPSNVEGLKPKWVFTTGGDVSATPTVEGDASQHASVHEGEQKSYDESEICGAPPQPSSAGSGISPKWIAAGGGGAGLLICLVLHCFGGSTPTKPAVSQSSP